MSESMRPGIACRMRSAGAFALGLVVGASAVAGAPATVPTKTVAAPPDDVIAGIVSLPDPRDTGVPSAAALLPIEPTRDGDQWTWTVKLPIPGPGNVSLAVLAPRAAQWAQRLDTGDGEPFDLRDAARVERTWTELGSLAPGAAVDRVDVRATARDTWTLSITTDAPPPAARPAGYVLFRAPGAMRLYSHLTSHDLVVGARVGISTRVLHADVPQRALHDVVHTATVRVMHPDGSTTLLPMRDDGRHDDGIAGDGVFGAVLPTGAAGLHIAQVRIGGQGPHGAGFLLTSEHLVPVVAPAAKLAGRAIAGAGTNADVIDLALEVFDAAPAARVRAAAEVWGTTAAGRTVPVCWLGGIRAVTRSDRAPTAAIHLDLDRRWLDRAGAGAPLELRNVRLHDIDLHVPVSRRSRVVVDADPAAIAGPAAAATHAASPLAREMLMGRAGSSTVEVPAHAYPAASTAGGIGNHVLMLVHGYCASPDTWTPGHFAEPLAVFLDPGQNRSHDEFALLIHALGMSSKSYGVVGHSQGGPAALHLYTYYWSGLDWAGSGRLIQSVGAPYQGTPLAGSAAVLGDIFGVGCGENFDLSYDGAALWLSGIPSWSRETVHYWTTSFEGGGIFDYCNFLSGLLLTDPEDGVVEQWAGQLPGATNMGHKVGWCHTDGMQDPPQTQDTVRNTEMSQNAAR